MELHFVNQGSSKTPLVLLHAFPVTYAMWQHQIGALSDKHEVYALDLPGFGSSPTLREDASIAAYARAVLALLDEQGIGKAVFGGCSMGGYIIFEIWRQAKKRVAGMILCDTRAEADTEATKEARQQSIENVRANGLDQLAEGMIGKVFGETTISKNQDLVASIKHTIQESSPVGVIHALQAMASRPDSTEDLSMMKVPALILVGSEDKVTPMSAAKRMADELPNAELIEIANAGHLSPIEQPEAVNAAMQKFLK
jgi:pimeloyl-ACP methyl ester carboxylesterase